MQILRIQPQDTYKIRQQILRPNGTLEDCRFPGDFDDTTFHLGGFVDKSLVSLASFSIDKHPLLKASYQYRLRGMATLPEYRGKGFGAMLLKTAFPIIIQNQGKLLWCNARISALEFYKSVGMIPLGEIFTIEGIGPHILMYRSLEGI